MTVTVKVPFGQRSAVIPGNTIQAADIESSAVTASKIASNAVTTAKINAGAVTGVKIDAAALKLSAFTGKNLAGACTLTGAKVGDVVSGVNNITDGTDAAASFETAITVADQIQQSAASDLSTKKFSVLLIKKG